METVYELTDAMAHPAEEASDDGLNLDDLFESGPAPNVLEDETLSVQHTIEQLTSTDMILGCLDAMRPRVLANCIAAMQGVPYINGGVAALEGAYHQFTNRSLIEMYGPGAARDTTVMSVKKTGPARSLHRADQRLCGRLPALAALQRLSKPPVVVHPIGLLEHVRKRDSGSARP